MKLSKIMVIVSFFSFAIIFMGCSAAPPKVKLIENIPNGKKVLLIPTLNSNVSISKEVTSKIESVLNKKKYGYISSNVFTKELIEKGLTNDFIQFVNAFRTVGVINGEFLKKFDYDYFILTDFEFETSDRSWLASSLTESKFETVLKDSKSRVRAGESWSKATVFLVDKDGSVIYEDSSELKLPDPYTPPKVDKMSVVVEYPLMRLPSIKIEEKKE